MKNKLIVLLLTIVFVATFGVACINIDSKAKLIDFKETQTEEAVLYGELYELRRVVVDESGNEYLLSYEVKDSAGAPVTVIANCFEAVDLGGYTIVYTATISENDVRTSTVTVPVYDGEGPAILVGALEAGEINVPYVLPEISFNDVSSIELITIKVYLVGEQLTEIALTENEGEYSFTPNQEGTYRLSVYAKDSAGNESTLTKEFFVEKILVGEVFNPVSSKAKNQIYPSSNNNVFAGAVAEVVTVEENNDPIYGGSYMRFEATNPNGNWANLLLDARFETSEYASYQYVNVWVCLESTATASMSVLFFNDANYTQSVKANEWRLVTIEAERFFAGINDANTYFVAAKYNAETTAIRIGEILAVNPAELNISNVEDAILEGESVNVEFTVSADPADTEYNVLVNNAEGEAFEAVALGNGKYQVTLSQLGEYTVKASATNGKYGVATTKFAVVEPNRIVVDGEYANNTGLGKQFEVFGAHVERGETITEEEVTVKLYALSGEEWVDVTDAIADGKYVPTALGKIKVEYSIEGIDAVSYEIEVLDYSVVFNPAAEKAGNQVEFGTNSTVYQGAQKLFVTAEENDDETYGGAYFNATAIEKSGWGNLFIYPKYTAEEYADYDVVTAWIYIVSENNNPINALFAMSKHTIENIVPNQWVQVSIPMDKYIESLATGTPVFIAINYASTSATAVYIGEIVAADLAELSVSDIEETILDGESVNVEFTVTASPADAEYEVSVISPSGAKLQAEALGEGRYQVAVSEIGEYTVNASAINGRYGKASTKFTVVESVRMIINGTYANTTGMGKELSLVSASLQRGETITEEEVTVKLYSLVGENWVDVSNEIADGKYVPTALGKLKVEYTFEGLDAITYEIAVVDPTIVFDPASEGASSQISADKKAFNNGPAATFTFVSDADNNDETYGGAYVRVGTTVTLSSSKSWGDVLITPTSDLNSYSEYTTLYAWIYIEGVSASATVTFFNTTITETLSTNQWVVVDFNVADFIANGTNPFYGSNFFTATWGITGVRVGKIFVAEPAELTISTIDETTLEGDSVNVEFTVTASPADAEYEVVVEDPQGGALDVEALGEGRYQVEVTTVGNYTVKVSAINGRFGTASAQFTVKEPVEMIVDGTYASTTGMGKELTLIGAHIERSGVATEEVVTVKVYALNGSEWVDASSAIADGKYVPTALGKIKVEYTFESVTPISYEITVVDPSIVFDPASESASSQVSGTGAAYNNGKATYTFVSDEQNIDETYSGAYVQIGSTELATNLSKNFWGDIKIASANAASSYSEYTKILVWIYIEKNGDDAEVAVSLWGGTAQTIMTNQWVQVEVDVVTFMANASGNFYSRNFSANGTWGYPGIRVGQIIAV